LALSSHWQAKNAKQSARMEHGRILQSNLKPLRAAS